MELSKVNECIEDMNVGAGAEPTDLSDAPKEIKEKIINNAELLDKDNGAIENFITAMRKARIEAIKQGIRANAVVVKPGLAYVSAGLETPAMLLGMACYIDGSGELPEEYAFAIVDSEPPVTREDKIRAEYLNELRKLSLDELVQEVYGVQLKEEDDDLTRD